MISVYPGSFDPITHGHLDLIQRAASIFDTIIVAVLKNSAKEPLFSAQERVALIREATRSITTAQIEVEAFDGLLIEYMKQKGSRVILRGLRAIHDFEYELQIASINRTLSREIETLYLMSDNKHSFISSANVKELARYGADVTELVPRHVAEALYEKLPPVSH